MKSLRSNPFVVLADVTIALCFIFAVYAVSSTALNSRLVIFFDRDKRQKELGEEFRTLISKWFSNHNVQTEDRVIPDKDGDHVEFKGLNGALLAKIQRNASFQRVSVYYPVFGKGQPGWPNTELAESLYLELGAAMRRRSQDVSYVYLHGIVQDAEIPDLSPPTPNGRRGIRAAPNSGDLEKRRNEWARRLSTERAYAVFGLLQSRGVVAEYGVAPFLGQFGAKFVIPYGTGKSLYTTELGGVGRVDILLFYGDVSRETLESQAR